MTEVGANWAGSPSHEKGKGERGAEKRHAADGRHALLLVGMSVIRLGSALAAGAGEPGEPEEGDGAG